MAANVETGSAGKGRHATNAEVNVTPFVDVMLVLLIIFMVSAPLATISIPLDLPPPNDTAPPDPIDKDGYKNKALVAEDVVD